MSFFGSIRRIPREPDPVLPEWFGPPRSVVPGYSAQRARLLVDGDHLVQVHRFLVYPTGVEMTLSLYLRETDHDLHEIPWELHSPPADREVPPELLRFGIEYSDGRRWTNTDYVPHDPDQEPDGIFVAGRGGGGGGDSWDMSYWLWPLPPSGTVAFYAEWKSRGFDETKVEIDADELRQRAMYAEEIWPQA